MVRPNFYFVGAPKAGTSALSMFIAQHPQICMCGVKEPNFHCGDLDLPGPKTEEQYLDLFTVDSAHKVFADCSILYLYSKTASKRIKAYSPDAKFLAMVRNPVDAIYSWHSQMVFTANEPLTDFSEALGAERYRKEGKMIPKVGTTSNCPELLYYSEIMKYGEQLERFLDEFPRENIMVIVYDDFVENQDKTYKDVIRFLGLDDHTPDFIEVNKNKERVSWKLHYYLKVLFAKPARKFLPLKLRLKLINILDAMNSKVKRRPKINEDLKEIIMNEMSSDVDKLGELIGRNLKNLWWHIDKE